MSIRPEDPIVRIEALARRIETFAANALDDVGGEDEHASHLVATCVDYAREIQQQIETFNRSQRHD